MVADPAVLQPKLDRFADKNAIMADSVPAGTGRRNILTLRPRLETALRLLQGGEVLADIGCDHGRFGAAALRRGLFKSVIASDISAPSLGKAKKLADKLGLTEAFSFRLSDGLSALAPGEADHAVLLGMGGELIVSILESGKETTHAFRGIIMQPMRGEAELRQYLYENGYAIDGEAVTFDSGRYYQLIAAHYSPDEAHLLPQGWPEGYYQFGPAALEKHEAELLPMMRKYLAVMRRKLAAAEKKGHVPAALIREEKCTAKLIEMYLECGGTAAED